MPGSAPPRLRLGTRRSPLALAQAHAVADALCTAHHWPEEAIELVEVIATGDKVQDRALAEIGGKALWTRELDRALAAGTIDAAVHSMKDVETLRPPDLTIAAMLPRADVRDRLIGATSLEALPQGAVVGTASPRRRAQLLTRRPDLAVVLLRGNVGTRLAKLAAGEVDATLLAAAGLDRLGHCDTGTPLALESWLPAPGQGAIGVEVRAADAPTRVLLSAIDHPPTHRAVVAERALLAALDADCHSPVAALAVEAGQGLRLRATLFSEDGVEHVAGAALVSGPSEAEGLARDLLARAPPQVRARFAA